MRISGEALSWPTGGRDVRRPPGAGDSGAGVLRTQS